jgi:hypothetical protein
MSDVKNACFFSLKFDGRLTGAKFVFYLDVCQFFNGLFIGGVFEGVETFIDF